MSNFETVLNQETPEKKSLSTFVDGWIISNHASFITPIQSYFGQWPNAKFKPVSELECRNHLQHNSVPSYPDIVILDGNCDWVTIANQLKKHLNSNVQTILLSESSDTNTLRHALKSGVKDVLTIPFDEEELDQILYDCASEKRSSVQQGTVSAFINAKGGMGATIIATTVAHIIALEKSNTPLLIDTDAQFGCTSNLLSTPPKLILSDALSQAGDIDELALNGMLTKHKSGLKFISSRSEELMDKIPEYDATSFNRFLLQAKNSFNHVIVDLSRGLENSTLPALVEANNIFIVVQQCIPAISEAATLIKQLRHLLGINQQHIKIIVNRYTKSNEIKIEDIRKSLHVDELILIPNDYQSVNTSTDLGELLATHYENKTIVKELRKTADYVMGKNIDELHGIKRFFSFLRS